MKSNNVKFSNRLPFQPTIWLMTISLAVLFCLLASTSVLVDKTDYHTMSAKARDFSTFDNAEVIGVEVVSPPDKVDYIVGETFDSTGLKVSTVMSDGSTGYDVSDEIYIARDEQPDMNLVGTQEVKSKIYLEGGWEAFPYSFFINIHSSTQEQIIGIEITKLPQQEFSVGDRFTEEGIEVSTILKDGSYGEILDRSWYDVSNWGNDMNSPGTYTVSVQYEPEWTDEGSVFKTSYQITVKDSSAVEEIIGIGIYIAPIKTTYNKGELLDTTGMEVRATTMGGYFTNTIVNNWEVEHSTYDMNVIGQQKVTISATLNGIKYFDKFNIIVKGDGELDIIGIVVRQLPYKLHYTVEDDLLDLDGLIIAFQMSDGSIGTDLYESAYYVPQAAVLATPGIKTLEVIAYIPEKVTTTFQITVRAVGQHIEIIDMKVTSLPNKTEYELNEPFDSTGLKISSIAEDTVEETLSPNQYSISNVDTSTPGKKVVEITATFDNNTVQKTFTKTFEILVIPNSQPIIGIHITKLPTKTIYKQDEDFDPSGLEVVPVYEDETEGKPLSQSQYTFSSVDTTTIGEKTVRVSANLSGSNYSTTFKITVEQTSPVTAIFVSLKDNVSYISVSAAVLNTTTKNQIAEQIVVEVTMRDTGLTVIIPYQDKEGKEQYDIALQQQVIDSDTNTIIITEKLSETSESQLSKTLTTKIVLALPQQDPGFNWLDYLIPGVIGLVSIGIIIVIIVVVVSKKNNKKTAIADTVVIPQTINSNTQMRMPRTTSSQTTQNPPHSSAPTSGVNAHSVSKQLGSVYGQSLLQGDQSKKSSIPTGKYIQDPLAKYQRPQSPYGTHASGSSYTKYIDPNNVKNQK